MVSHLHISIFQVQKCFHKSLMLLITPQGCDLRYFLPSQHLPPAVTPTTYTFGCQLHASSRPACWDVIEMHLQGNQQPIA